MVGGGGGVRAVHCDCQILCLAALSSFLSKLLKLTGNNKQGGLLDTVFRPDKKPLTFLNT